MSHWNRQQTTLIVGFLLTEMKVSRIFSYLRLSEVISKRNLLFFYSSMYSSINTSGLFFFCFLFFLRLSVPCHIHLFHSFNVRPSYNPECYYYIAENRTHTHIQTECTNKSLLFFLLPIARVNSWIDCQNRRMMIAIIEPNIWHGFNVRYLGILFFRYVTDSFHNPHFQW
jgi:hypothetical protein